MFGGIVSDLRINAAALEAEESGCVDSNSGANAPAIAGAVGKSGCSSPSLTSTTSAMTTVMLSGPPERSANSISRCAATDGVPCASASPIVDAVTGSDKPSEHNSTRSPART